MRFEETSNVNKIGLWTITGKSLARLAESEIQLETQLEKWIAEDPSLIRDGLTVVGRQVEVEGGRIDLLAVDPQDRWAVIEVKRGALRREAITQAIDYAASIEALPSAQLHDKLKPYLASKNRDLGHLFANRGTGDGHPPFREVLLFIVGTGRGSGVERMSDYLAQRGIPITAITFDVFDAPDGSRTLAREISEAETPPPFVSQGRKMSVPAVRALADQTGVGQLVERVLDTARDLQLYLRPYRTSVMITPPSNHTRMLFTVWGQGKGGKVRMYVGHTPFAEYFPVTERTVALFLGEKGWRWLDSREVEVFSTGLQTLMTRIDPPADSHRPSRSRVDSPRATRAAERFAADSARALKSWKTRRRGAAEAAKTAKKSGRRKPAST
jgi:Holliday junction resolvase-like predicted endonuclease